jgi:hypothetical protein
MRTPLTLNGCTSSVAFSISWQKGAAVQRLLPECELLALMDVDVILNNWSLPLLEVLERRWHFNSAAILMPLDPDAPQNYVNPSFAGASLLPNFLNATQADVNTSATGPLLMGNSGFMIFRNRYAHALGGKLLAC